MPWSHAFARNRVGVSVAKKKNTRVVDVWAHLQWQRTLNSLEDVCIFKTIKSASSPLPLRASCAMFLYGGGAFEPVEEGPVGERQWASTVGKARKAPLLFIKTQHRAETTRSRRDNKFSSHASGNTKPG